MRARVIVAAVALAVAASWARPVWRVSYAPAREWLWSTRLSKIDVVRTGIESAVAGVAVGAVCTLAMAVIDGRSRRRVG